MSSCADALVQICKEYHSKVYKLEGDKWDLERGIKIRILEVPSNWVLASGLRSDLNLKTHIVSRSRSAREDS